MQEQTDGPVRRQNHGRLDQCPLKSDTESGRGLRQGLWVQMEGWESNLPLCIPKVPRPLESCALLPGELVTLRLSACVGFNNDTFFHSSMEQG